MFQRIAVFLGRQVSAPALRPRGDAARERYEVARNRLHELMKSWDE